MSYYKHKILNKYIDSMIPVSMFFFSANYYNSYKDEKINFNYNLEKKEKNSYIGHIMLNHGPILINIFLKSALLSLIYPFVFMDIATNYYYGNFYKQHLIFNYENSKEYEDFQNKKK